VRVQLAKTGAWAAVVNYSRSEIENDAITGQDVVVDGGKSIGY
jgi:hypothetical protein